MLIKKIKSNDKYIFQKNKNTLDPMSSIFQIKSNQLQRECLIQCQVSLPPLHILSLSLSCNPFYSYLILSLIHSHSSNHFHNKTWMKSGVYVLVHNTQVLALSVVPSSRARCLTSI